jgi:hypothetical protein
MGSNPGGVANSSSRACRWLSCPSAPLTPTKRVEKLVVKPVGSLIPNRSVIAGVHRDVGGKAVFRGRDRADIENWKVADGTMIKGEVLGVVMRGVEEYRDDALCRLQG